MRLKDRSSKNKARNGIHNIQCMQSNRQSSPSSVYRFPLICSGVFCLSSRRLVDILSASSPIRRTLSLRLRPHPHPRYCPQHDPHNKLQPSRSTKSTLSHTLHTIQTAMFSINSLMLNLFRLHQILQFYQTLCLLLDTFGLFPTTRRAEAPPTWKVGCMIRL